MIPIGSAAESDAEDAHDIALSLSGDGDAYRRLVERYQAEVAAQMRRFSRDPAIRDELTHDVFVEAYTSLRSYRGTAPWLHWLRKVGVRVGYRYWKRRQQRGREVELTDDDWRRVREFRPEPRDATAAADLAYRLLAQLGASDRLILTLLYLDGCTLAEAVERAGWSVVGAKVRAFRARRRLRQLIAGGSYES